MMSKPQKSLIILGALLAWFAIITQGVLMMENRVASIPETILRFFSFFTILTNTLVAVYFTSIWIGRKTSLSKLFQKPGAITAITVYITVVGLVYQLVLRQIWEPQGLQQLVDELLHSVNPLYFILYWYLYEEKAKLKWPFIPSWLLYPLLYSVYILIRGSFSGFYPYPFVNVAELGLSQVLLNSIGLVFVFLSISVLYIGFGKVLAKGKRKQSPRSL